MVSSSCQNSELKYFLRGFPPHKATQDVVVINTSPMPDLDMDTIRRKCPGHVQKEEIRQWSLRKTPSLKELLDWTPRKSSRVNLQDNRIRHHNLAEQKRRRANWSIQPDRLGQEQYNMLAANNRKRPDRSQGPPVNNKRWCYFNQAKLICKTIEKRAKSGHSTRPNSNFFYQTAVENWRNVVPQTMGVHFDLKPSRLETKDGRSLEQMEQSSKQ